jgi:pimeloyl-ACP methyl ester carboxylesterase
MQIIKNITIPGANSLPITLDVFFERDIKQKPIVLYAHGFNGFKDWGNFDLVASKIAKAGFVMVKFNFSYNGTTPQHPEEFADLDAFGKNNYTLELADLLTVTDWVCDKHNPYNDAMDVQQIFLIGHSMGAGIATIFAAEDSRIKKLVLWAGISECKTPWGNWPASKIKEWEVTGVQYNTNSRTNQQMPLYYQLYQDYQLNQDRLDIKKSIAQLKIPVLICHGSFDLSVPVEKAYELKECQPAAELFIVESNHVFDRRHPWIMTYLPEAMEEVVNTTIHFFYKLTFSTTLATRL